MKKPRCLGCMLPPSRCLCEQSKPLENIETQCSLIMNKGEFLRASNTGKLLKLLLPDTQILIRGIQDQPIDYEALTSDQSRQHLVLFPVEQAVEIPQALSDDHRPKHLIIPDGNWSQAAKIAKRVAAFPRVTPVKLPFIRKSEYKLRKNPHPEKISTFESIVESLCMLEGHDQFREEMLTTFERHISLVMMLRGKIKKKERENNL